MKAVKRYFLWCVLTFCASLGVMAVALYVQPYGPEWHLRIHRVQHDLQNLKSTIEIYKRDRGLYPPTLADIVPDYQLSIPSDKWGSEYVYRVKSTEYDLYSVGTNGIDELLGGDDVILGRKEYSCDVYGTNCPLRFIDAIKYISAVLLITSLLLSIGLAGLIFYLWLTNRFKSSKSNGAKDNE